VAATRARTDSDNPLVVAHGRTQFIAFKVTAKPNDDGSAYTAMVNEALCKILCHNLCCLVQSAYELGITATFWQNASAGTTKVGHDYEMVDVATWI
jgi:hypothetical protein